MIGMRLLYIYERVHLAGYTYNDLKLDNILVGSKDGDNLHEIRLTDFGFAEKYIDREGLHKPQDDSTVFRGNMIFATQNQFEFRTTSRKDDLLSLTYLLVYLLKN